MLAFEGKTRSHSRAFTNWRAWRMVIGLNVRRN